MGASLSWFRGKTSWIVRFPSTSPRCNIRNPAAPFTTSTLQQEAAESSALLGAVRTAQGSFYEGKEVGEDGP